MKYVVLTSLLFLGVATDALGQQPARRGLDQIDLLSVPRTNAQNDRPVEVNAELFELLEPLVRYCRELERNYKTSVMDKDEPLTPANFGSIFSSKADAIQRSLFLIRKMEEVPPQVAALLRETDQIGWDISIVVGSLFEPPDQHVLKDLALLSGKYGVSDGADAKQLVAAILRRLNANFARIRVVG